MKVVPIRPDYLLRDVRNLPVQELWDSGIRGILYDLERTLEGLGERSLSPARFQMIEARTEMGFRQGLCTNSTYNYTNPNIMMAFGNRIAQPNEERMVGKKPNPSIFLHGAKLLGLPPQEILMVGDKLLFDTSPAAALGMKTALVNPMPGHDVWAEYLAFRRTRERLAMRQLGIS